MAREDGRDDTFEDFCRMLRPALLMIVRWIDKRYPHLKSKSDY